MFLDYRYCLIVPRYSHVSVVFTVIVAVFSWQKVVSGTVFDALADVLMCVYGCVRARFGRFCGYFDCGCGERKRGYTVRKNDVVVCLGGVRCRNSAMRDDAFCNVWYYVSAMYGDTVRRNTLFVRSCNRIAPENATV